MLLNCGAGEDSWESLGLQGDQTEGVNPKGNQPWIFIGRTHAETEAPILWPPDVKSWLIGKDPDTGKDWGQKEKRAAEDEMVRWDHQLNRHESEQASGDAEGQRSPCAAHHGSRRVGHNLATTSGSWISVAFSPILCNVCVSLRFPVYLLFLAHLFQLAAGFSTIDMCDILQDT